jgi:hypothetical protein
MRHRRATANFHFNSTVLMSGCGENDRRRRAAADPPGELVLRLQ